MSVIKAIKNSFANMMLGLFLSQINDLRAVDFWVHFLWFIFSKNSLIHRQRHHQHSASCLMTNAAIIHLVISFETRFQVGKKNNKSLVTVCITKR